MNNQTFKYKGRNLYISAIKDNFSTNITFILYNIDKIKKTPIDFSEKELAKIELIECLKELSNGEEISKAIVAQKIMSANEIVKGGCDILLKIKDDLLKELK